MKINQIGRSMVEMLGVLAIIGVLSVGSIAGYSKAMFKYKLNKHATSFNQLLNSVLELKPQIERSYTEGQIDVDILLKDLGLIPNSMKHVGSSSIIDIFNNYITIYYNNHLNRRHYVMEITMERSNDKITARSSQICQNIVTVTKENSNNIYYISLRTKNNSTLGYSDNYLYGGLRNTNQIISATTNDIYNMCNSCTSEYSCTIILAIDIEAA